jgi:hypothetical protein
MLITVVILNLLITLGCLLVAFRMWKLQQTLARATNTLEAAERRVHRVLYRAPEAIRRGQVGIYQLRQTVHQLEPQLQQARQVLMLLSLGRSLWQSETPRRRWSWTKRSGRQRWR